MTPHVDKISMEAFLLHVQNASSIVCPSSGSGVDSRKTNWFAVWIASGSALTISSFRSFDLCDFSAMNDSLDLMDAISAVQATRQTMPAALSISKFHLLIYRVLRSILSRSTVGITEGADIWAFRPVVCWVGNPMKTFPTLEGNIEPRISDCEAETPDAILVS